MSLHTTNNNDNTKFEKSQSIMTIIIDNNYNNYEGGGNYQLPSFASMSALHWIKSWETSVTLEYVGDS